jgi:transcriptional regulator with XRE-family HTH domain
MSTAGSPNVLPTLGARVAALRDQRGFKQQELAKHADLSVTFLSEVENDHRKPGADALLRLADALETTLDYLVKGELPQTSMRKPMVIPSELAAYAEELDMSLQEALQLLSARDMVVARRSGSAEADDKSRGYSKEQWKRLHDWLKSSPR